MPGAGACENGLRTRNPTMIPFRRAVAVLGSALGTLVPAVSGHTHVEVVYREGQLRLVHYDFDYGETDPAVLRLPVGLAAARRVPDSPPFTNLLGAAGTTAWILPQQEDGDLLWLGIGSGAVDVAEFVGGLELHLVALEGPAHIAVYFDDPFGRPVPVMNTSDGVDAADTMTLPLRSHLHCNWAFSAPGVFRVRLVAAGTLRAGNVPIVSVPTDFVFEVAAPPAPWLGLTAARAEAWEISLKAHRGLDYVLEASPDLDDWTPVAVLPAAESVTTHLLHRTPGPSWFFRARLR